MAKSTTRFVCSNCNAITTKWAGQCSACGEWNTIAEDQTPNASALQTKQNQSTGGRIIPLQGLKAKVDLPRRIQTGIGELDAVLGGGIVPGSVLLITGEPGIGKSTLLIQAVSAIATKGAKTAYISGEEAADQVRLRAQRLGLDNDDVLLGHDTNVRDILSTASHHKVDILIIDSIQTMRSDSVDGTPGGMQQIKACGDAFTTFAKQSGTAVIMVGHVNKGGDLAGPKHLEHMVDAVLQFEGDRHQQFRLLRAIKNRYGATDTVGVWEMAETGLVEVTNPSSLFLVDRTTLVAGSCVTPTIEGGRPILVEVQALVVKRNDEGYARRNCVGFDPKRLDIILAVLEVRYGVSFTQWDCYLSTSGGYRLTEPGADLAVAAALLSARLDTPIPEGYVAFGELSLSGDVRPVPFMGLRLKEATKLGFQAAWTPKLPAEQSNSKINAKQIAAISGFLDPILRSKAA